MDKEKIKKASIISIISIIICIFVFWFLPNIPYIFVSPSMGVKQFDKICSLAEDAKEVYKTFKIQSSHAYLYNHETEEKRIIERYRKEYYKFCNVYGSIESKGFNDEMLKLYLSNHSFDELVMQSIKVLTPVSSYTNLGREFIERAASIANVEAVKFDFSNRSKGNWYSSHPDAEPQNSSEEVQGRFYSHSGENITYESKTNTTTVNYHGDFAIAWSRGYHYYAGSYGWSNGVFHDSLPGWIPFSYYEVYFRDSPITSVDENDFSDISTLNLEFFPVEITDDFAKSYNYFCGSNFGGLIFYDVPSYLDNMKTICSLWYI